MNAWRASATIPVADTLIIEARINPADIDQIQVGQETRSAFNQRTTPETTGGMFRIAADLIKEAQMQRALKED